MANFNETQQKFRDISTLHAAGIDSTPEELALLTGGEPSDCIGIHIVHSSPALKKLEVDQKKRLIFEAGMADTDGPIGFALILKDLDSLLERLRK